MVFDSVEFDLFDETWTCIEKITYLVCGLGQFNESKISVAVSLIVPLKLLSEEDGLNVILTTPLF